MSFKHSSLMRTTWLPGEGTVLCPHSSQLFLSVLWKIYLFIFNFESCKLLWCHYKLVGRLGERVKQRLFSQPDFKRAAGVCIEKEPRVINKSFGAMQRLQHFLSLTLTTSFYADIANHKAGVYVFLHMTSEKCCNATFEGDSEITAPWLWPRWD